ncbi:MAG: DNA-directed RNA polymerase subunit beta' [Armatimonadetes bacterium]|nr:DNA-directed RNA polymerase subunit beta' [Armatimonadota bacterium]
MVDTTRFDQLRLGLASSEEIRRWSKGEVKKPETINYRTFKPEPDGLFCERIFGPTRDWECHCGKYRKIKFRGITCDRCGVEVTRAKVRRERMGHIELAAPVSHIWYLKGVPSPMSLLLNISPRPLEKVIYFASYIVTHVDYELLSKSVEVIQSVVEKRGAAIEQQTKKRIEDIKADRDEKLAKLEAGELDDDVDASDLAEAADAAVREEERLAQEQQAELELGVKLLLGAKLDADPGLTKKQLVTESEYRAMTRVVDALVADGGREYEELFAADLGATAIHDLLKEIDLEELCRELRQEIRETTGPKRARAIKRLEVSESFRKSKNRPEWMVLDVIPVIPPELRPMVQLDGGRFATSDLNDLYRRIINRNNRLKKIKALHAPESIINHEKRLLQEAVDALIDNGRRSRPVTGSNNRPLKSLSDMLKGKEGRFRKNLLGKRVDYSGRSVIVVNPYLKLHQCGLPKEMALELFKPFVMKRLVERGFTTNVKTAKKMVDRMRPEVWDALEEVIQHHPILLNRAPTLHRLGIQAFEPTLVDGKAIQIHPLVCLPFNADFDGDQMAAHVPLSTAAQAEARILMMSTENLFSPADGRPMVTPTRDIILGCYYLTQKRESTGEATKVFANALDARLAYDSGKLDLHEEVRVRLDGALMDTTVGRIIFNEALPPKLRHVSRVVDQGELSRLVRECYRHYGTARTVQLVDDLKTLGFQFATIAGITISMTDMDIPRAHREQIIAKTESDVQKTNQDFARGLISAGERSDKVCRLWNQASGSVSRAILENIDPFNPIYMMANSGARGTPQQITQIAGMRGLMSDPFGRFIEDLPIKSNFHEGLTVLEYFVSTHGARKGLADTALRTADAGYLTRRLVDVSQDVIIREEDCGTSNGISVSAIRDGAEEIESLERRIDGRIVPQDVVDPRTDAVLLKAGSEISDSTDQPCPSCGGDLENHYQCQSCARLVSEAELTEQYVLAHTPLEEEPEEEMPAFDLESLVDSGESVEEEPEEEQAEDDGEAENLEEVEEDAGVELGMTAIYRVPSTLLLEESRCSECQGPLEIVKKCADCETQYSAHEVVPSLTAIKQAVEECEAFRRHVRIMKEGEPAPADMADPFSGSMIVEKGKIVRGTHAAKLRRLAADLWDKGGLAQGQVLVRSALSCELAQGICAQCYGRDFATNALVEVGEAVGIIAAQSIGEPGTQLTMRTFHTGGVAGQYLTGVAQVKEKKKDTLKQLWGDVKAGIVRLNPREEAEKSRKRRPTRKKKTERSSSRRGGVSLDPEQKRVIQQLVRVMEEQVKGLLRVVELFEARRPKGQAIVSEADGVVARIETPGVKWVIIHSEQVVDPDHPERLYGEVMAEDVLAKKGGEVLVETGQELTPGMLAKLIQAKVKTVKIERRHLVPYRGLLPVRDGDEVRAGDALTEGPLDPQKVLQMQGVRAVQDYIVREIQAVYRSHGVDINDKHIEVIVRQMLRKRRVVDPGDTDLLPGKIYDRFHFDRVNREIRERKGQEATGEWVMLGITEASLATDSWLSAASFQKTTRVLTEAAIQGKVDNLVGLKENVIIGRLIPAGTGMESYRSLRVQGPPGEAIPYVAADREAELLRSAFGDADFAGPEEELIRDLADVRLPESDEDGEGSSDEEDAAI